jgi:hypothetical protein
MKHSLAVAGIRDWWPRPLVWLVIICWMAASPGGMAAGEETASRGDLDNDAHLMGWWTFDDDQGTLAKDSSQQGRDGVLEGGVSFDNNSVTGRIGKALDLDGRENLVRIADYRGVTGTSPRSVCVWIKTETPNGEITSWGKDDFGQMWRFCFIRRHVGVTPSGGYYYMAADVHDNQWHHLAVVLREAELPNLHDDVTLYLDGQIAEIDRIGLLDLWPIETGSELDVVVGKRFKGSIDDLRIYSRPLADEEVETLHGTAK